MKQHVLKKAPRGLLSLCGRSLILLLFAQNSMATPLETNLTLTAALKYGAENSPGLQAALHHWKSAEQNITVQKALPDPTLTYGYYVESVETRVGPQNQSIQLTQKIPGFGKLALAKAIATDLTAAAGERYRREKLALDTAITQGYAELYYLKRNTEITEERIQLMRTLEQIAQTRYAAGAPMAALLQAQLELGKLEEQLASLNDLRHPTTAQLNAALNRPADAPLPWPADLPDQPLIIPTTASNSNPELAELGLRVMQSKHQLHLAKRERLPDFTLGLQYIETGEAKLPVSDSGKDPIIATIGINLPIWFGKNRARIASAAHQKTAAELQLESREKTLEAEIRQALFNLRDADRKMTLYRDTLIPKAQQSLNVNRNAYEAGSLEFINLIDAERALLEFERAHERARADRLIARAKLSQLTGTNYLSTKNQHKDAKDSKNKTEGSSS